MSEVVAGVRIPDSKLARQATDLLREHGTSLLFAHSLRVYLFGAIRGRHRKWTVDPELLYFGAVFHDLGLTAKHRSPDHRFEVDSANTARDFLRAGGIDEATAAVVWDAIALHTTPEIPWHKRPEIALVTGGVEADVLGDGLGEIPAGDRDAVLAAYPRIDFKRVRPGVRRRLRPQAHDHVRDDEQRRAGADAPRIPPAELLRTDRRQPTRRMSGTIRFALASWL
jgi:hypothetical protein